MSPHLAASYLQSSLGGNSNQELETEIWPNLADPSAAEALHDIRNSHAPGCGEPSQALEERAVGLLRVLNTLPLILARDTSPSRDRQVLIAGIGKHGLLYRRFPA